MNNYYKILVMFHKGDKITRSRLLRICDVTAKLLDECVKEGYLIEFDKTDAGEVRYMITAKGIIARDN